MDYRKLDGPLATDLNRPERPADERTSVFIRTEPNLSEEAKRILADSRIDAGAGTGTILTGELSHEELDRLSEQPWVTTIHLARKMRPLSKS